MSYLLGTETLLAVVTAPEAYPPPSSPPARHQAAQAARDWSEQVSQALIHWSIITYGEICLIRDKAQKQNNLPLFYQLEGVLESFEAADWHARTVPLTKETMPHWARIWGALGRSPDLESEDAFILAQALTTGFTYVGPRSAAIAVLERIGLTVLDPLEWRSLQSPA